MANGKDVLLSDLEVGSRAVVEKFTSDDIFLKLMEMGCVPGENIQVVKKAPFGDPISITVAGYNLSLRLDEAKQIIVQKAGA